jgi:hypothetical protein
VGLFYRQNNAPYSLTCFSIPHYSNISGTSFRRNLSAQPGTGSTHPIASIPVLTVHQDRGADGQLAAYCAAVEFHFARFRRLMIITCPAKMPNIRPIRMPIANTRFMVSMLCLSNRNGWFPFLTEVQYFRMTDCIAVQ